MSTRRFRTTEALVAWMEDEYLSEIVLTDVEPAPSKTPPEVARFTWQLHGGGRVVPYRVTARGVRAWTLKGRLGDVAASVEVVKDPAIGLRMASGGTLTLRCDRLEVARGRGKRIPQTRGSADYMYMRIQTDGAMTIEPFLAATGLGADELARWVKVALLTQPGDLRLDVSVSRADACPPEAWLAVQRAVRVLGKCRVGSAWEFDGSGAQWLAMVAKWRQ